MGYSKEENKKTVLQRLYDLYYSICNPNGKIPAGLSLLIQDINLNRKTLIKSCSELVEEGLIKEYHVDRCGFYKITKQGRAYIKHLHTK